MKKLNTKLNLARATEIKALLWEGHRQEAIADHLGLSQTTISRILHGKQWTAAKWPDGSPGQMPVAKVLDIQDKRAQAATMYFHQIGDKDKKLSTQPSIQRRDEMRDRINQIAEEYEAEVEEDLHRTMTEVSAELREGQPDVDETKITDCDAMPWYDVLIKAPNNRIVIVADESGDYNLKLAIGIAFKALPKAEWKGNHVKTLINEIYQELQAGR